MNQQDKAFSHIFAVQVEQYHLATDERAKQKIKEAMKEAIKKWTDQPVRHVSQGVLDLCTPKKIKPFELLWPDRNVMGKDEKGKSRLLWEHTTPVGEFYETLLECKNLDSIQDAMMNYSGVCWILREEDDALNANGYRSKRPGGWAKCYNDCGIYVVTKWTPDA